MAKPTLKPEWATGATGIAETVEPSAGKKADGWADEELPPHSYFNWLFNIIYSWIVYFDRGDYYRQIPISAGVATVTPPTYKWEPASVFDVLTLPVHVESDEQITEFTLWYYEPATTGDISMELWRYDMLTNTPTQLGTTQTSPGTGVGIGTLSITSLTETVSSVYTYYAKVIAGSGGAGGWPDALGARVKLNRP